MANCSHMDMICSATVGADELSMSQKQSIRNEQEAVVLEDQTLQNSQCVCCIMYCGHIERIFLDSFLSS